MRVYFCLMNGLRGCYMPDSVSHYYAESFEQFAEIVRDSVRMFEHAWNLDYADDAAESDYPDADSDDARVVELLRHCWEHAQRGSLELCLAIGASWDDGVELNPGYGLTVSQSSESEYQEAQEESN